MNQKVRTRLAFVAGALLVVGLPLHWWVSPQWASPVLIAASLVAGTPIAIKAWQALRVRAFSIDLLVTIAVVGALIIGEYVESAVVSFLFLFGAWLEARSLERTRSSLRGLIELAPTIATVEREGVRQEIPASELEVGDLIVVRAGERIAVDGVVAVGEAEVSEASITGEPIPVGKRPGDHVFASTIVETGFLQVRAKEVGDDTTYARIIELVEEAQESKTRRQRFLDRFSQYYTPAIVVGAIVAFALTRDLSFALTFLVIACPGALVISVPVAAVAALGNIARHGVLSKDAQGLEDLAGADTLVLDKTGTLTQGQPSVTGVHPRSGVTSDQLLTWAASVELASEHHLGRAVVRAATERDLALTNPTAVEVWAGLGLGATVDDHRVLVGSERLLAEQGLALSEPVAASSGATAVLVAVDSAVLGWLEVSDPIRPEAQAALEHLRQTGFKQIIMLSGDRPEVAAQVGTQLGLDRALGGLLPGDKAEVVADLQREGRRVAMVGDGVNDAPALARAQVGVAMGRSGTDVSVETADLVLLTDRLDQLAHARRVSQLAVRIMKENMTLALGTVAFLLAGVLFHAVHLAGGMLIHEASVLLVVLNALRLTSLRMPASQPVRPRSKLLV